ncbi:hypothetical protein BDV95DRAFT_603448 [Massariosphaeria phaeospora]|uniref:Uncharacterized protein n=1 Tax=Massariosphaeria phaeospora TaxID=100035 RepID=A0A7C8IJX3_9PLEO|nr:hypothetical protein BDV95DRAFT_603448 [Massariosphaeria phaeospora]
MVLSRLDCLRTRSSPPYKRNFDGLGYFRESGIAPTTSIPTVFHQLHCLYLLRRAYYAPSEELQVFDFGKDRASHVAHCFDYLQQGLTCSADTTVESAKAGEHEFLGTDFVRECRDFEALKNYVEPRRVFNATGFLARGLVNGHIQLED